MTVFAFKLNLNSIWNNNCFKACMLICSTTIQGCSFWLPFIPISTNSPPEILHSDPPFGAAMKLSTTSPNIAFVVAQDQSEDDTLRFQWYISGSAFFGAGESLPPDGFIGSKIELNTIETTWHNRSLNCVVYDNFNASANISWPIEILEEN